MVRTAPIEPPSREDLLAAGSSVASRDLLLVLEEAVG